MTNRTHICLAIGSQMATMLAAAVVLMTIAEGVNWLRFWRDWE